MKIADLSPAANKKEVFRRNRQRFVPIVEGCYALTHFDTDVLYVGREDNMLWRRLPNDAQGRIEAAGAKSLGPGDTCAFGEDMIHSVVNPTARLTGAIHIYDGDFFGVDRSEWEPDTLDEKPYDMEKVLRMFEAKPTVS